MKKQTVVRIKKLSKVELGQFSRLISSFMLIIVLVSAMMGVSNGEVRAATPITFTAGELLGKPTDTSITINIVPASQIEYHHQYGTTSGVYPDQTINYTATGGQPHEITITGLTANTRYYYRMRYHTPGDAMDDWVVRDEHSFMTQRATGSTFIFTVTSDDHYSRNDNTKNAMQNILNDPADFHIDLGDTFYIDSSTNQSAINDRYLAYREPLIFGKIGPSVPIFLSSGNHEDEEGWNLDDMPFSSGVGNIQARKAYFPTPVDEGPGGFYSGNTDPLDRIDDTVYGDKLREDYYAWEWGDALFVVIDPFQYTMNLPYNPAAGEGSDDPVDGDQWSWTLGQQQYDWLTDVLENSTAKYKFMFSHNMLGGIPRAIIGVDAGYVRGGAEAAAYFEWGGNNASGVDEFATKRPGWSKTIHQLMVDNGVSAYFHGHDHQYVYERRDNIVYQEVPSPGMTGSGFPGIYTVGTYADYETISMYPSSGYLRITVGPEETTVEYVRSNTTGISDTYTIEPNTPVEKRNLTISVDPAEAGITNPPVGVNARVLGSTVNVTATANLGYAFDHWSGACTGSGSCSVVMTEDKSVTAHFTKVDPFTLTTSVSPAGAGTVSPSGSNDYNPGTVVTLNATAASGYSFANWTGDVANASSATTTVTMNADKSVTANFTAACYALTLNHTGNGTNPTASPTNSTGCAAGSYHATEEITLSGAVPDEGYEIGSWSGTNNNSSTASTNTLTMPAGPRTVSVNYIKSCYALSLTHTGSGANPIASPANSTGCTTGKYTVGQSINLSGALPASGWWIQSWEGTANDGSTASNNYLFMPAEDHTVTVNYVTDAPPTCYALTLGHEGQGSDPLASPANSMGCSAGTYTSGQSISLSGAVPASGWEISAWLGTSNDSSTASTNSLTMPASNHTASVVYTQIPPTCYALTLTHEGEGSDPIAMPSQSTGCDPGQYVAGESISLSGAIPETGWQISGWMGTSNDSSAANTNTLTMPASARTVSVIYIKTLFNYLPLIIR